MWLGYCDCYAGAYAKLAKALNVEHIVLNASKKVRRRGIYHIQDVNGYHARLKTWLDQFKGIASKYLNNYLALLEFVDKSRAQRADIRRKNLLMETCLSANVLDYKSFRVIRFPAFV